MSAQGYSDTAYASLFSIELLQGVLSTSEHSPEHMPVLHLPLQLPRRGRKSGISLDVLTQVLQAVHAQYRGLEAPAGIVLGAKTDPFFPIEGRLDAALKTIEILAAMRPDGLIIQTRSPLILLAAPLLLAIRDRLRVVIAMEAAADNDHHHFTPEFPRPSERLETASALADLGIHTVLQFSPISDSSEARDLAQSCRTYCAGLRMIELSECINGAASGPMPRQTSSLQARVLARLPESKSAYRSLTKLLANQGARDEEQKAAA